MLLTTEADTIHLCAYPWTAKGIIRSAIYGIVQDLITAIAEVTSWVKLFPHFLKKRMAPKIPRNPGDKTDNAKSLRSGRDKGDLAGVNRRPTSMVGRQLVKNTTGQSKDLKASDNMTPPAENKGKSKTQATINSFLTGGAQEIETTLLTTMLGGEQTSTEGACEGASSKKSGKERLSQSGTIRADSGTMEKWQETPLKLQHVPEVQGKDLSNIRQTRGSAGEQGRLRSLGESAKSNGKEIKNLDWSKDTGDKFYSLTEESELSSTEGHSLNDSGSSSISSEEGNASSNNELTVRQRHRQRKCIKRDLIYRRVPNSPPLVGAGL
ncbi:hypothetical protein NDU88_003625 [Pleurodeles waltl]|uniref:Uncharacterized protein n=1 Tax=Pleurodeles waltl TaxID=8319 RepID=A0AAV7NH66_PLEWA|nr:hypothetical protein NDU88_003625 [Pleurodeles waltl]